MGTPSKGSTGLYSAFEALIRSIPTGTVFRSPLPLNSPLTMTSISRAETQKCILRRRLLSPFDIMRYTTTAGLFREIGKLCHVENHF